MSQSSISGRGRWRAALIAGAYLAVACVLLWPLPVRLSTHMPGEAAGDPLLNAWILGWDADRLAHGLRGLWEAPHFYPAHDTLAWSEHLLGIALFVAPAYWLTGNVVLTYNLALVGSVVLAGAGAWLLARELTGRADAAWIAGLAFAALPYRAAQVTHLQVLVAGWMPLALLGLHRYFRTGSRRGLALFAAAYVLQALSNGYYLFFLAVPVAIVCAWSLAARVGSRPLVLRAARDVAVAAVLIVVLLAPAIHAYLRVRETYGLVRSQGEIVHYSADLAAYGSVVGTLRVWGGRLPRGEGERELFPGLTLLVLSLASIPAIRRSRDARMYLAVALAGFALSFGPEPELPGLGRLPTGPYDWAGVVLPGFDGLRVPARIATVTYLGLSMLAAFGCAWLFQRMGPRGRIAALAVLSVSIVAEGLADVRTLRFPTPQMGAESAAYEWLSGRPRGPMLEMPVALDLATRYMYRTLTHGNRIVNGYSGYQHGLQGFLSGPPSTEPEYAADLVAAARAIGLRYLVVHEHLYDDRAFAAELVRRLAAAPGVARVERFATTSVLALQGSDHNDDPAATPPDPALPLEGCAADASHNAGAAGRALDGIIASRWLTVEPQRGAESFSLTCPHVRIATELVLRFDRRSGSNYPRRLVVETSMDGETFKPVWEGSVLPALTASVAHSESPATVRLLLEPSEFRTIRLRQTGRTRRYWFWAIPEIEIRGR